MLQFLRYLLLPFTALYALIMLVRNCLYNWGVFKSHSFAIPVISVGNLMVGGTGKTPVTEYLVSEFEGKRIAILSRGYGRKTKGYIKANEFATADTIGDEPMQYYSKFPKVTVAVCESRVEGIRRLIDEHDIILLDDAFQHRSVKPGLSILLFDFTSFFEPQFPFPTGNMREPWIGAKRADIILITKSPATIQPNVSDKIRRKFKGKQLYFSTIKYGQLTSCNHAQISPVLSSVNKVILITGIAKPKPLIEHLEENYQILKHFDFPDHHAFSTQDFQMIATYYSSIKDSGVILVTTEKDIQRINSSESSELLLTLPLYYLPIEINIVEAAEAFNKQLQDYVSSN